MAEDKKLVYQMTPAIRERLEKLIEDVPGPALAKLCDWLEEIRESQGYGSFTLEAKRGEIEFGSREYSDKYS